MSLIARTSHTSRMSRIAWGLAATAVVLGLTACAASTSPNYDKRFGDGVRSLAQQQTLNPDATRQNEGRTLAGDGRMVRGGVERAVDTYRNMPVGSGLNVGTVGTVGTNAGSANGGAGR